MADFRSFSNTSPEQGIASIAILSSSALSLVNFRDALIARLVGAGLRVWALAPDHDDDTRARLRALGAEPVDISLDRTGMHPLRDLADMIGLAHTFRRLAPDAVLGYFVKPVIFGSLAARLARVKHRFALVAGLGFVFTPEAGRPSLRRKWLRRIVSALYGAGFAACHKVFFQNGDDIAEFAAAGLIDPAKAVQLNGTGVDLSRFAPAPPVTEPVSFILVARMLKEKGIVEFATAARAVKALHPDARFHLAGGLDPNPGGLSRAEIQSWADEGILEWHGHVEDVRPLIAASSVFVLPSFYREGKPRSTQEALAMAKPVITTDWVGCRDTVVDGVNGFLVPIRDSKALEQAMLRFIGNPALIPAMGAESRRLAEERFDIDAINDEMLAVMGIGKPIDAERMAGGAREPAAALIRRAS